MTDEELMRLRERMRITDIAKLVGVPAGDVRKRFSAMRKAGYVSPGLPSERFPPEMIREWKRLLAEGKTLKAIGEMYGCDPATVCRRV